MTHTDDDDGDDWGSCGSASGFETAGGHGEGRQLLLFPDVAAFDPEGLRDFLERGVGAPVRLVLTRNRMSVLTFKRGDDGTYEVRLQRVFLEAPDAVLGAVISFVRRPSRATRERVVQFFSSRPEAERRERRPTAAPAEIRAQGQVYDLAAILGELNGRYFDGAVASTITWGLSGKAATSRHGRGLGRTIRFGSYVGEQDLIRIHPALDADWVPRFFVESVVFHEMLHAIIPIARDESGRRLIHPPEFRRRERIFHAFDAALEWEKANLRRLLGARG